jgi:hypothetical protein
MKLLRVLFLISCSSVLCFADGGKPYYNRLGDREYVIDLSFQGKKVSGSFRHHNFNGEDAVQSKFKGEVIDSNSKQKKLEIRFTGPKPYESPDEKIIWKWTQNGDDKHILIPIVYLDRDESPPSMKKTVLDVGTPSAEFEGD